MEIKEFSDLRKAIGRICGQAIGRGQIREVIKERGKMNAFDSRGQIDAIIAILEFLENKFDEENQTLQSDK